MNQNEIFKDLVVIELASALAGPSVGMFFAELGAKVIKIENASTGGDVTRRWRHPAEEQDDEFSTYYFCVNWRKKSRLLNLKKPAEQAIVHDLIKDADIVVSNFKPGSAAKLGMDYETLKSINPRIIYGSISAYGEHDPRPGFDALMQAETGWMSINGRADGPPTKVPLPMIDILAGHQMKEGILIALLNRAKTNQGSFVCVSLYDASLAGLANQASTYLNLGIVPERIGSAHPSIVPYGDVVTTKDSVNYMLAVGTQEHFESLCDVIGQPELLKDSRFSINKNRLANRAELVKLLQEAVLQTNAADFEKSCDVHGVPLGPINDIGQVLSQESAQSLVLEEVMEPGEISKRMKTAVFRISCN